MSFTIPSTSQVNFRKLLQHPPKFEKSTPVSSPVLSDPDTSESSSHVSNFDADVVMILAILLLAVICVLGLNTIVRCILRCTNRIVIEPEPDHTVRLATNGVKRKALRGIPVKVFTPELKLNGSGKECTICLSDLVSGDRVRILPKCCHGFHVKCIDRWLMARPSCPTCRQCLFTTVQKASDCGLVDADPTNAGTGTAIVHAIIVPLGPEEFVHDLRVVS